MANTSHVGHNSRVNTSSASDDLRRINLRVPKVRSVFLLLVCTARATIVVRNVTAESAGIRSGADMLVHHVSVQLVLVEKSLPANLADAGLLVVWQVDPEEVVLQFCLLAEHCSALVAVPGVGVNGEVVPPVLRVAPDGDVTLFAAVNVVNVDDMIADCRGGAKLSTTMRTQICLLLF